MEEPRRRIQPKRFHPIRDLDWPAILIILLGTVIVLVGTRWGVGTSPDSITYLGVSANLAKGRGLTIPFGEVIDAPLGNFPPLYPGLLSIFVRAGLSTEQAARLIQVLTMVLNLLLVRGLVREGLRRASKYESFGMLLLLGSPVMVMLHWMAWSEALFMALGFGGLLHLLVALRDGSTLRLVLGSSLIALSAITRYAGIAFIITGLLVIVLTTPRSDPSHRVRHSIVYILISCFPLTAWLLFLFLSSGVGTGRAFVLHAPGIDKLKSGITTVAGWLSVPDGWPTIIKVTVLGIFVGVTAASNLGGKSARGQTGIGPGVPEAKPGVSPLAAVLLIFVVIYSLVILLTITFFDANTPLDDRLLSPVLFALIVILTVGTGRSLRAFSLPLRLSRILPAACMLLLSSQAAAVPGLVTRGFQDGFGFSSVQWRSSGLMQSILSLDRSDEIYSNSPEAIYARLQISTYRLPKPYLGVLAARNTNFEREMMNLADRLSAGGLTIVYFDQAQGASIPSLEQLKEGLSVDVTFQTADGYILGRSEWD